MEEELFSDGRIVTSPAGLGAAMNKFFLSKIRRLRASIPPVSTDPLSRHKEAIVNRQCSFRVNMVTEGRRM